MDGQERLPREDLRLLRERGADPRLGWEWLQVAERQLTARQSARRREPLKLRDALLNPRRICRVGRRLKKGRQPAAQKGRAAGNARFEESPAVDAVGRVVQMFSIHVVLRNREQRSA